MTKSIIPLPFYFTIGRGEMKGIFIMGKRVGTARWVESQKRWRYDAQRDGKPKSFYSSTPGRKGQREANAKADLWLDDGVDGSTKCIIMKDRFLQSLTDRRVGREHQDQNEKFLRLYAMPKIKGKRIGDITEAHLQDIINYAHLIGNKGNGLSHKTLKNLRAVLRSFIKFCRISKTTTLLPESLQIPNDAPKSSRTALQPDDIKTLFSSDKTTYRKTVQDDWYIHAYRLEVILGFRPGEILGLSISDIVGNRCKISRSINRFNETTKGKNDNAIREFEIPQIGMREIKAQRKMLLSAGIQSDMLFPNPDGEQVCQQTYRHWWNRYREYNKIADRTPYELRHTFFSMNKNMPKELIKPIGGHSEAFDGFGVYSHELEGDAHRAAMMIDETIKKILSQ